MAIQTDREIDRQTDRLKLVERKKDLIGKSSRGENGGEKRRAETTHIFDVINLHGCQLRPAANCFSVHWRNIDAVINHDILGSISHVGGSGTSYGPRRPIAGASPPADNGQNETLGEASASRPLGLSYTFTVTAAEAADIGTLNRGCWVDVCLSVASSRLNISDSDHQARYNHQRPHRFLSTTSTFGLPNSKSVDCR